MRFWTVLCLLLWTLPAFADPSPHHRHWHGPHHGHFGKPPLKAPAGLGVITDSPPPPGPIAGAQEGTFTELRDHDDAHHGHFEQHYFINKTYASGTDAPVILLLCGEYSCTLDELLNGLDEGGVDDYVKARQANLVILEHRYYGQSQPYNDISTEHLQYLTTDQALEDIVTFHDYIVAKEKLTGPWITIGGSYAGVLSAFARVSHPDIISGALSSSGPVHLKVDFPQYDRHAANVVAGPCGDQIRDDVAYFESGLADPKVMAAIRQSYGVGNKGSDLDLLDSIESIPAGAIQYSDKDGICAAIKADNLQDSLKGWLNYATANGETGPDMASDISDIHDFDDGGRQWTYQTCREYGYFQTANPDPKQSLMPRRATLAYEMEPCRKFFHMNGNPDVEKVVQNYTNPIFEDPTVTNILFTNAVDDPWEELGITPTNSHLHDGLTAFEYSFYAHHGDLKPTPDPQPPGYESVLKAKELFSSLLAEWVAW